jgi:2-polyprenyl-6-methoxyphenol hydroxylase-like FAD-dependent oxidoreductase
VTGSDLSGRAVTAAARYAVGCDGANSTVGDLRGVPVVDLGFSSDWLIVDVVLTKPLVSTRRTCRSATRRARPPSSPVGPAVLGVHALAGRGPRPSR